MKAPVLVYFYDIRSLLKFYSRDVQPFMGAEIMSSLALEMEDIISRARRFETVVIFPHPYCGTYTGIHNPYFAGERFELILDLADGVEVINSENLNKWNLKSALLGFNLNKCITVQRRPSFAQIRVYGRRLRLEARPFWMQSGRKVRSSPRSHHSQGDQARQLHWRPALPGFVHKNLRFLNTTSLRNIAEAQPERTHPVSTAARTDTFRMTPFLLSVLSIDGFVKTNFGCVHPAVAAAYRTAAHSLDSRALNRLTAIGMMAFTSRSALSARLPPLISQLPRR
jgi:hypothetical protein